MTKFDDMIMRDGNATQHGNRFDETTWLGHVGASAVRDRSYLIDRVKDLRDALQDLLIASAGYDSVSNAQQDRYDDAAKYAQIAIDKANL